MRRAPILLVVIGAMVAAVVLQRNTSSASAHSVPREMTVGVSVPSANAVSTSWYCAAGTSQFGGAANETIVVENVGQHGDDATITVMPGGDAKTATRRVHIDAGEQRRIPVAEILPTPNPGVVVETTGGRVVVSHELVHSSDVATEPCTRGSGSSWYFAAGTTLKGAEQDLVLFNPFGDDAIADVSLLTDTGVQEPDALQGVTVPRTSRVSLVLDDSVPRQRLVAARVHTRVGRLVAERVQIFDGSTPESGPTRKGIAVSLGSQSPSRVWHFASATTAGGGTSVLSVANFGDAETRVVVNVALPGSASLAQQELRIPARSVVTEDVTARVPANNDYGVSVTAREGHGDAPPVVAELLATWPTASRTTGVASTLGSTITARRWIVTVPGVDATSSIAILDAGTRAVRTKFAPANASDASSSTEQRMTVSVGHVAIARVPGSSAGSAFVVTADQPVTVGLTLLGNAGASLASAVPDLSYGG